MASTSPAGASSNLRRSDETIPQPPATATVSSSRARANGVTTSPVGSTLASSWTTTREPARRRPMLVAAACPSRSLVQTISIGRPAGPSPVATPWMVSRSSRAAACSADGRSATITTDVPSGDVWRRAAKARARSSGQSVAISTTVARPVAGSSQRDGTLALDPYRIRWPSATSGGAAGVSAKSVPRSAIFQPAASISARSRSASSQAPVARAAARACAADRISSGIRRRVTCRS